MIEDKSSCTKVTLVRALFMTNAYITLQKTYIALAHINKTKKQPLYVKSSAQPYAKRKQDKRYWTYKWKQLRKTYLAYNPTCVVCGWAATVVDHITPVSQGGNFWRGPFQAMCKPCHQRKSAKEQAGTRK